ncbi:TatD family hydrolase [Clostridium sp. JS66]|uniref:TatD family hydrolase n=1 Tax=Clostridium sp. JS66 TaxID=3064705 RepID=UPI00298EC683|nr:TatD family hydrolase [Clostridium sp. JS66]WPC42849.1 TatD family hydrolase [Clostridium sp. JS66]
MNNLVDFHFHLDYYKNYYEWYNYLNDRKIYALCVTNLPEIYEACVDKFEETKYVKFALGYNPQEIRKRKLNKRCFERNVKKTKYIGEVGLDYSSKFKENKDEQVKAFDFITKVASAHNKILSVHSRASEHDVLNIIVKNQVKYVVFHWYNGDKNLIKEIVRLGYYFSVNSSMIETEKGKSIIKEIPMNRLLVETDGPFSRINGSQANPKKLKNIYCKLENFLEINNLGKIVLENLNRLLLENLRSKN